MVVGPLVAALTVPRRIRLSRLAPRAGLRVVACGQDDKEVEVDLWPEQTSPAGGTRPAAAYSLEVTGKAIAQLEAARADIPLGTPVNIAFLGNEDHAQRVGAARAIRDWGLSPVPTQMTFDADALVRWVRQVRAAGIDAPLRLGVPGPARAGTLLRFARQFGVSPSAQVAERYGLPTDGAADAPVGPERFWDALQSGLTAASAEIDLGVIGYHLYPFGGMSAAVRWMNGRLTLPGA